MNLCTKFSVDDDGNPVEALETSLVFDDHEYGMDDEGFLHVQGTVEDWVQ